jgi:hypothetical protein
LYTCTGTIAHSARRKAAMRRFCGTAQLDMDAAGLLKGEKNPSINRLLNRLLGMHVSVQEQIFAYFTTILDKVRLLILIILFCLVVLRRL